MPFVGEWAEMVHVVFDERFDLHGRQFQLFAFLFQTAEVEQLVDEPEQVAGVTEYLFQFAFEAESPALRMSSSSGVMMSASGVRNSWLMLVKKRNLSSSRCCSFCRFRFSCSAIMRERLSAMYSSMM